MITNTQLKIAVFRAKIAFCWIRDKHSSTQLYYQIEKSNRIKSQLMFFLTNSGTSIEFIRDKFSKLTFRLCYHNLLAFFSYTGDITGACWQKPTDLQFSPKMCYNEGASANHRMTAAVWAEKLGVLEKVRRGIHQLLSISRTYLPRLIQN